MAPNKPKAKADETAAEPAKNQKPARFRVRNHCRRPLTFCCPSTDGPLTVRLGPGEEVDAPEHWMHSVELARFLKNGMVGRIEKRRRMQKRKNTAAPAAEQAAKPSKPIRTEPASDQAKDTKE